MLLLGAFLTTLGRNPLKSPPTPSRAKMETPASTTPVYELLFSCICLRMVSSG